MGQLGRRPNRPRGGGLAAAVARARGLAAAKTGAITFVQRFGGLVGVFGPAAKARSKLRALIPATHAADAPGHMSRSEHADPDARPPAAVGRPAAACVR